MHSPVCVGAGTFTRADKEEHRGILMSVHDDPEAFSGHQLHHFLKHAELEQRVAVLSQQGDGTKRISQEAGRRYILTQASPAKARREYADDSDDGEAEFVVQAPVPAPNEESDPFASLGGFLIDEDEPPAPLCTPVASRPPASATLAVSVSQPPASAPDHPVEAVDIPVVVIEDDEDWEEVVVAPPSSSVSLAPVTLSRSAVERQPFVKVTQQVLPQVAPAPPHADPVSCVDKVEHGREVDDEEWEEIPIEAFALPSSRPTPAPSAVPLVSSPVPPVPSFLPPARPSLPLLPPSLLPVPPSLPPPQPMEVGVASTGTALNRPATSALVPTVDSVDSESSDVEISDEQYFEDVIGLELDRELKKNVSAATGAASEPVSSIIHAIQDAGKIG